MSQPLKIDTLIAETDDMASAAAFYQNVLGFVAEIVSPHWTSFPVGGVTVALHSRFTKTAGSPGGWILGYAVDDLVGLHAKLVEAGATIVEAFHDVPGGVILHFLDRDGNHLQAIQRGTTRAQLLAE